MGLSGEVFGASWSVGHAELLGGKTVTSTAEQLISDDDVGLLAAQQSAAITTS